MFYIFIDDDDVADDAKPQDILAVVKEKSIKHIS
jgi:hypothetical protein